MDLISFQEVLLFLKQGLRLIETDSLVLLKIKLLCICLKMLQNRRERDCLKVASKIIADTQKFAENLKESLTMTFSWTVKWKM